MRSRLDTDIQLLKEEMARMTHFVAASLSDALKALKNQDRELAKEIIDKDIIIDEQEVDIDEICLKIFSLSQPVAIDFRLLISALRINNDLERIADLSAGISKRVLRHPDGQKILFLDELQAMGANVIKMYRDAVQSFEEKDIALAESILVYDDIVDKQNKQIISTVIDHVHKHPQDYELGIGTITISKNLERIADLATNICEDTIYYLAGEIIKHQFKLKQMKNDENE